MTSYLWSGQNWLIHRPSSTDHHQSCCRKMPKMCSGDKKDYYIVIITAIIHVQCGYIYMRIYVPKWKPYWLDIFGQTNWWDKCQYLQLWLKTQSSEFGKSTGGLLQRRPVPPCLNGANRSHFFTTSAYWWCVASLPTGVRFRAPRKRRWLFSVQLNVI